MIWMLQDAKNRFSELFEKAHTEGPQWVTRRGKDAVVVISAQEWADARGTKQSLADFFASSPLPDSGLRASRDTSPLRPVEF